MRKRLILAAAALTTSATAVAAPPSPPVFWAGCAGALAVKAERSDRATAARYGATARRALAQARIAANPQRLTVPQINGVAVTAAKSLRAQIASNPVQVANFERAVTLCSNQVAKLPN